MKRILARLSEKEKSKEESSMNKNSKDVLKNTENSLTNKTDRTTNEKVTIETKSSKPRGSFKETFQARTNKAESLQQSISKVDINKNLTRKKSGKENSKINYADKNEDSVKQPEKKGILDFANKRSSLFSAVPLLSKMKSINSDHFKNLESNDNTKEQITNTIYDDKAPKKKEYYNRFSIERISFMFDEYSQYPDDNFSPSIFFFKFLSIKPDFEGRRQKVVNSKLKLYIPDTIVFNDSDSNYWIYTDVNGNVARTEVFSDSDILEKFRSPIGDDSEILAVSKIPNFKGLKFENNILELLNQEELERYIFSKNSSPYCLQRFVKCRGPKAFVCRSVWRRTKPAYVYILTNIANYHDNLPNQNYKFVINTSNSNSFSPFYATSGKHLEETSVYMTNIVKFIEGHSDLLFEELVGDFVKDEAGIWWLINIKAFKIHNLNKFISENGSAISSPSLEYFINRRKGNSAALEKKTRKFDYQTKIKCKFCGINYSSVKLKYNLTTKMIIETDRMLKHIGNHITFIERPDLKHTDCSMIYLPYRVCEDCYLLFETMNDIKNYQIEIANFFKNPVDAINFGLDYYAKEISVQETEQKDTENEREDLTNSVTDQGLLTSSVSQMSTLTNKNVKTIEDVKKGEENRSNLFLYRIMIMFTDLFWNENLKLPHDELYLLFNFLGNWYKVKIKKYYEKLDYFNINFFKVFYIVCDQTSGFIEYVEKNRHMDIKLGYFETANKKNEIDPKIFNKDIVIEDADICKNIEDFIEFASVELSLNGLKYGEKYRNSLNGLLFKREKPHYVGKLRCLIRISKEGKAREENSKSDGKEVYKYFDISKYNLRKHFNIYIPPVHFVISDELQDYWLEIVERHKLRESVIDSIFNTMRKNNIVYDKSIHKEEIFKTIEILVSHYLNKHSQIK